MKYITAGESHGNKITVIVEDVPYGIPLRQQDIDFELKRRSFGYGRSLRQQQESDTCCITAGVANKKTTGAPVCIEIENSVDASSQENFIPRPGHADLAGAIKYGVDDLSFISERASARETACRVAAGTIAKNMLAQLGTEVYSYVTSVGPVSIDLNIDNMESSFPSQADIELSQVRCPDASATQQIIEVIDRAKEAGDTLGGSVRIVGVGLQPSLGSFAQASSRIDSQIAAGIMSIPSVKAVKFGSSDYCKVNVGSASVDQLTHNTEDAFERGTNYAGGVEGGMTNGMPLIVDIDIKPVPTVSKGVRSIDLDSMDRVMLESKMRHDICVVPAIGVIAEAEIAIVLANAYMKKFGNDTMSEILESLKSFCTKLNLRKS